MRSPILPLLEPPTLSLHMMVLNAESVIERAIRSVIDHVDEVVLVDTGSTDHTVDLVEKVLLYHHTKRPPDLQVVKLSPETCPQIYIPDNASTWHRPVAGPFTDRPLLSNWAAARNCGMELCRGDFILKLDADDEVMDPWCIPNALLEMLNVNARYLVSPYEVMDKGRLERFELLDRITWNDPDARYRHPMHECLENPPHTNKNTLISAHDLRVRDHRDSKGEGVRINSRNFKVLLHEFETASTPSIHCLMYLAREALQVDAHFAKEVLEGLMERDLERPMMAEAIYILGKAQEVEGEYLNALHSYSTAFRTDVQFQLKARLSAVRLNHRLQPSRNTISEMESLLYDIDTCIPFGVSQTEIAEVRGMLDRC